MGIIYKIYNDEWCYIGSTMDLKRREREHKKCCNNAKSKEYNCKKYKTIRENGGWINFKMEIIQKFNYDITSVELRKKEQFYIQLLNPNMNEYNACLTEEDRVEYHRQYNRQYRLDNKEQVKQHYQDNKEKIKEREKQYKLDNKEKIKEQKRLAYLKKKNALALFI